MPISTYDGVSDEPVNASACAAAAGGLTTSAGEVWTFTRMTVMPPGPVQTALYAFWFPKVKFTESGSPEPSAGTLVTVYSSV